MWKARRWRSPVLLFGLVLPLGCSGLEVTPPGGPVLVGASYRVTAADSARRCSAGRCEDMAAPVTSLEILSGDAFEVVGPDRVVARRPGTSKVHVRAEVDGDERTQEIELEAAEAETVELVVDGVFAVTRFSMVPGGRVRIGWRAQASDGRFLVGEGAVPIRSRDGALTVESDGSALVLTAGPVEGEAVLEDPKGALVATGRLETAGMPDALEVLVADGRGSSVPIRVLGRRNDGSWMLVVPPIEVELFTATPEVCLPPDGSGGRAVGVLGAPLSFDIVFSGRCRVRARARRSDGTFLDGVGEGLVALLIPRVGTGR